MIKNIVFDLGNVLLNFKPLEYLRTKLSDEEKINELYKAIFLSEEWLMLDRGVITEKDAINRICERNENIKEMIYLCMNDWYQLLTPIKETVGILKSLKEHGYKAFVLSNFHMLAYEYVIKKYDFFDFFDGGIISYQIKLLKPEAQIYKKLIKKYAIKPEETIFIDDNYDNIEAAKELSFNTILFHDPIDLRKKFNDFDINI